MNSPDFPAYMRVTSGTRRSWDEIDRRHARHYEAEQEESARFGTDRFGGYRGNSQQWSDRDEAIPSGERSGPFPGTLPSSRGGAGPVGLRAPRTSRPSASQSSASWPSASQSSGLAPPPSTSALPDGVDPTPLFTATEYVAVGDSPLYRFVAEFIAIGSRLPDQEVPPVIAAVTESPVARSRPAAGPTQPVVGPTRAVAVTTPDRPRTATELEGGRHRDGWRVAGHRSVVENGRRAAARTPRHRAA